MVVLYTETNGPALFNKEVLYDWLRPEKTPVDYLNKKLKLMLLSVSVYMQVYKLPEYHCAREPFTAADSKLLRGVA